MPRHTVNIEVNQYIVVVATIVAAVAAGYLSYATGTANPLVAAATAGAIGFALSYLRARYGAAVIIVGALVFFFTFTQAPPRPSPPAPEHQSPPPVADAPPTPAPVSVEPAARVAPVEVPRTAVVETAAAVPLPELVRIPAGSFLMGCQPGERECADREKPAHRVQVAAFELGKTEVTFAQWDAYVASGYDLYYGPKQDEGWGRGNRPVIHVSWDDAQRYVTWLGRQTGQTWRLPTEAEWEYAARAGTETPFSTGRCVTTRQANYNGTIDDYASCGAKTGANVDMTQPVGSYPANPWGLYDMHGNVWEWVQDCYHADYPG